MTAAIRKKAGRKPSKLTARKVREILALRREGATPGYLAKRYHVAPSMITAITQGKVWREVWEAYNAAE